MTERVNKGNMKSVSDIMDIIEKKYTYIPLLQRNYKWTRECAAEFAEDLWNAYKKSTSYQLNMITIYNNNDILQIIDGQQRLITLKLFLSIVGPQRKDLNFDFERDNKIDERSGRRYFINYILKKDFSIKDTGQLSVDVSRLWDNYLSMIVPLSFRTVFEFYNQCLSENKNSENDAKKRFKEEINPKIKDSISVFIDYEPDISNEHIDEIEKLCSEFLTKTSKNNKDEQRSNDEIRESEISDRFQEIWQKKIIFDSFEKIKEFIRNLKETDNFAQYILDKVEFLYHETESEPIDEFLNINQNKTRFVISDYIRALMISDNAIDENATEEEKKKTIDTRKEILALFSKLSMYLYSSKYSDIWELVKVRYGDFEKDKDINRLKVIFCDKYPGTSTKGYEFEAEFKRLKYFADILQDLAIELGLEERNDLQDPMINWNTYNSVKMLLDCKKWCRFFNLFDDIEDIDANKKLNEVVARERFCFYEYAFNMSEDSEDPWDISYFFESQLYDEICDVKKNDKLPEKPAENNEWCYIGRGPENNNNITAQIEKIIRDTRESKSVKNI